MRGDEHHAELVGREHHGHVHVAGQVRQPFGVTGIGKAGEMERVLVGRSGDDRIHLAGERQARGRFDAVAGDASGPKRPRMVGPVTAAGIPGAYRHPPRRGLEPGRHFGNLVLRADQGDLGVERLGQRASHDLGSDAARIAERDCEPRGQDFRMST